MEFIVYFLTLLGISLCSEDHPWPWKPDIQDLDLGKDTIFTEIQGNNNHTIQVLVDKQTKYLAIKDLYFHGCYLIDTQSCHMGVEQIITSIKKHKVAVLPGEFDVKYPNIPHNDVITKFGHRIGHLCKHNPTMWLVEHIPTDTVIPFKLPQNPKCANQGENKSFVCRHLQSSNTVQWVPKACSTKGLIKNMKW